MKKINEDAPVNSAGNGGVDGIGVGPKGEPGGKKSRVGKILRRKKLNEGYGYRPRRPAIPSQAERDHHNRPGGALDRALNAIDNIGKDKKPETKEKSPGYEAFKKRYDARKEAEKKSHPDRFQS